MPKIIDYPRTSFSRVLEMASAIDSLGGSCKIQSCADKMGVKVTGSFSAMIGAGKKHDLYDSRKGELFITDLYKNIKLAYDETEKSQNLKRAFLSPPVYRKVFEKFKGKELPISMLDKLLVREFNVEEKSAPAIAGFFVDGARSVGLLKDNKLVDTDLEGVVEGIAVEKSPDNGSGVEYIKEDETFINQKTDSIVKTSSDESYTVHISGPGINSKLVIAEEEDFIILEAMFSKLKKKMR